MANTHSQQSYCCTASCAEQHAWRACESMRAHPDQCDCGPVPVYTDFTWPGSACTCRVEHHETPSPSGRTIEEETGWRAHTLGYPSRSKGIKVYDSSSKKVMCARASSCIQPCRTAHCCRSQELAAGVAADVRRVAGPEQQVWAVTHSLGGIVVRHIMGLPDHGMPATSAWSLAQSFDSICRILV